MEIMVDIETLGTATNSVVASIGAVRFDANGIGDSIYLRLDMDEQVKAGRVINIDTIKWWMGQDDAARAMFKEEPHPGGCRANLVGFINWMGEFNGLWGNGSDFDNAIIADMCLTFGVEPWPFWKNRCYRTLKNQHPDVPFTKSGVAHNALDDAKMQAHHAVEILERKNK